MSTVESVTIESVTIESVRPNCRNEKLLLRITNKEIGAAKRFGLVHPILYALQDQTGTLWRIHDDGHSPEVVAIEAMTPYRVARFTGQALYCWRHYASMGEELSLELEIELEQRSSAPEFH